MTLSATVYVEHPKMALVPTIRSLSDLSIQVVSDAGTDPDHDVHYFWFEAPDFEAVEEQLLADPTVADFSVIVERANRRIYCIEYSEEVQLITPTITEVGGLTRESRSHSNGWEIELQLQGHDALYALNEYALQEDIHLDVLKLDHSEQSYDRRDYGLTESQREALLAAFVNGYYDEPRRLSLEELTEYLDISPTAASGRLRRASARLIEEVLIDDEE
jgi:predicted DNA binding protein